MSGWGRYLGDESLAAPAGIVEALDEECQELPPYQLPAGDDPGSFPASDGTLVWLCRGTLTPRILYHPLHM